MELQYYSATLVHFPPIGYWCGAAVETLIHDSIFKEKERNFQKVMQYVCFAGAKENLSSPDILSMLQNARKPRQCMWVVMYM